MTVNGFRRTRYHRFSASSVVWTADGPWLEVAGKLGRAGIQLLVVDTESRYLRGTPSSAPPPPAAPVEEGVVAGSTGGGASGGGASADEGLASEMARAAGGRYYHLPNVTEARAASETLSAIVNE